MCAQRGLRPRLHRILRFIAGGLWIIFCLAGISPCGRLRAQDNFEIRVEQYEQLPPGAFTLEEHFNYVAGGPRDRATDITPASHQLHFSTEITGGVSSGFSLGSMLLTATLPGHASIEYAGWRILPHLYLPQRWHLPVKLGLTAEFSFQGSAFDENTRTIELRPIIEKSWGKATLDFNPSVEHSFFSGPAPHRWTFEPSVRLAYEVQPRIVPSLEYYSFEGSLWNWLPLQEQVHQFYPGVDLKLRENLLWNVGVGWGATPSGNRLVYKTRLEFSFGRKRKE